MKDFINRFADPQTQYFTQGHTDIQTQQQQNIDSKRGTVTKPRFNNIALQRVAKIVKGANLVNIIAGEAVNPQQLNVNEEQMIKDIRIQEHLASETDENLEESFRGRGNPNSRIRYNKEIADGKRKFGHVEHTIQHKNVVDEILNQDGKFHASFYDLLYHPVDGLMFKHPNELTGDEKNFAFGYSQDLIKLSRLTNVADKLASRWLRDNKNFVNWATHGDKMTEISVPDPKYPNRRVPKLVHHGTISYISPVLGLTDRHMGVDEQVLGRLKSMDVEMEKASHLGTVNQAQDLVLDKLNIQDSNTWTGDGDTKEFGPLRSASLSPETLQTILYKNKSIPKGKDAKFYSGFVKMNNPLRLDDVYKWTFDNILDELKLKKLIYDDETLGWTWENSLKKENSIIFNKEATPFPKLVSYFGRGTAVEQVLSYGRQKYEEDMSRAGLPTSDWNKEWNNFSFREKADIHYYKMQGLIQFINKDLGYDGIVYKNIAEGGEPKFEFENLEDQAGQSRRKPFHDIDDDLIYKDSYILFHPWQFKSIYNWGDFKWGRSNFMGKYSKGKNKYKKVV